MTTLGKRIREERQHKALTVRGLAAAVDVAPPYVTDIEADRRRPSPEVLAKIASVLDVPLPELEALDPRITPEVKEWMEDEPRVGQLLRRLQDDPNRDAKLQKMERLVKKDEKN